MLTFFFQAEDGIRDHCVTGVQTCALPISQTALTPEARLANVAGAFAMRNAKCGMRNEGQPGNSAFRIPHSALERPLILVDDVFTTGATLAEAARALDQAGARTVSAVTFGRAVVPDFT